MYLFRLSGGLSDKLGLSESHRIETEREDRIKKKFGAIFQGISINQGAAKVPRSIDAVHDVELPKDAQQRICLWVRHGWNTDESSVIAEARSAGNQDPTIFLFIPRRSSDEIRNHIVNYKAAMSTLASRGISNTQESRDGRAAMETIRASEESRINDLIDEAFSGARVFQAGGTEISGNSLRDMILEAAERSMRRLYTDFSMADNTGWGQVYSKAKAGAPDALKAVGDDGEVPRNPVCKAILTFIATNKIGEQVRKKFEAAPYGWSGDAIDGGIQTLLVSGQIRADGVKSPKELERKAIGKTLFHVETVIITTPEKIKIRKLFQKANIAVTPGQELSSVGDFLQKLLDLADNAGGDAPKPESPDVENILEIRRASGNVQLRMIHEQAQLLGDNIETWSSLAKHIAERLPKWNVLKVLVGHLADQPDTPILQSQVQTIEQNRHLLDDPDPITPLAGTVTQRLREELNRLQESWTQGWDVGEARLHNDENWEKISPEDRLTLRSKYQLRDHNQPVISVESTESILATLETTSLTGISDRIAALPGRYSKMLYDSAVLVRPEAKRVSLPTPTLTSESEVDSWITKIRQLLVQGLTDGPVIPSQE